MRVFLDALSRVPTVSIGTQALIIGSMEIIERYFPGTEFIMLSPNTMVDEWFLYKERFKVSIVERSPSQLGTIKDMLSIVKKVDAVVSSWGDGYITAPPRSIMNKTVFLGWSRKPVALFPSSIGPFTGALNRFLGKAGLMVFDILMARDTVTFQYLHALGLSTVRLVPDTAFIMEPVSRKRVEEIISQEEIPHKQSFIGLNISQLLNVMYARDQRDYPAAMAELAEFLHHSFGCNVLLIPHQVYPNWYKFNNLYRPDAYDGDDRYAIKQVMERLNGNGFVFPVMGEYSAREYKGICAECEMLVGGRMHSIIAALSSDVPVVLIQYSHKALGVMNTLDLENCVWDFRAPKETLFVTIENVWSSRQSLKMQIQESMADYKRQAWTAGELLAELITNYQDA